MLKLFKKNTTWIKFQNSIIDKLIFLLKMLIEGLFWFAPTGYSIKVTKLMDIIKDLKEMKNAK